MKASQVLRGEDSIEAQPDGEAPCLVILRA